MAKAKQAKEKKAAKAAGMNAKPQAYHNYIGGEWVKSSSGEWFDNVNPANTPKIEIELVIGLA